MNERETIMSLMSDRISELEDAKQLYLRAVRRLYTDATGCTDTRKPLSKLVKTAVAQIIAGGEYSPDKSYTIEHMADMFREHFSAWIELRRTFEFLFGMSVDDYHSAGR